MTLLLLNTAAAAVVIFAVDMAVSAAFVDVVLHGHVAFAVSVVEDGAINNAVC